MEPLTGSAATAALQLYAKLGASGTSFNGSQVATAVRSKVGRRHLSTVIDRARVVSTWMRPVRFGRARKARSPHRATRQPLGRSPNDGARPRPDGGVA